VARELGGVLRAPGGRVGFVLARAVLGQASGAPAFPLTASGARGAVERERGEGGVLLQAVVRVRPRGILGEQFGLTCLRLVREEVMNVQV
jgi:hypothetical protein